MSFISNSSIFIRTAQPPSQRSLSSVFALIALVSLSGGCASSIGDSCSTNIDCSSNGDRICDRSQPGGYCTVQGCTATSCPGESRCISFFPASFSTITCDPLTEDAVNVVNPTDDCNPNQQCLSSGFCVRKTLESRFCMKGCKSDGDCRGNYECRVTGTGGAERVVDPDRPPSSEALRFCAPKAVPEP